MPNTSRVTLVLALTVSSSIAIAEPRQSETRSDKQQEYAEELWSFINHPSLPHTEWTMVREVGQLPAGPPIDERCNLFANSKAAGNSMDLQPGSVLVAQHYDDSKRLLAYSVYVLPSVEYGWYYAHYLPDGTAVKTSNDRNQFNKRGHVGVVDDGRLWVFRTGSQALVDFYESGEPAKRVIHPGAGPGGITIMAADRADILGYLLAKDGFDIRLDEGRAWVFRSNSDELKDYDAGRESAKMVIRPGAGPTGLTLKATDAAVLDSYLFDKPGFHTAVVDGRLWVFQTGSEDLMEFKKVGEPAKYTTVVGVGPNGMTVRAPDKNTITSYLAQVDGYEVAFEDARLWVFRSGSKSWLDFQSSGFPAVNFTRPGAGPDRVTVRGPDRETVEAYLRAVNTL